MARDYKHGVGHKETFKRKSQVSPQAVVKTDVGGGKLLPIALGLSISFVVGFWVVEHFAEQGVKGSKQVEVASESLETPSLVEEVATHAAAEKITVQAEPIKQEKGIHYTFYNGLAATEVLVDAEPISVKLDYYYYIQAGSFGAKEVALKEQARLLAKGISLDLSELTTHTRTYYRLRMGPFDDRLLMNQQRNILREYGVDTLLVRSDRKVEIAEQTLQAKVE